MPHVTFDDDRPVITEKAKVVIDPRKDETFDGEISVFPTESIDGGNNAVGVTIYTVGRSLLFFKTTIW